MPNICEFHIMGGILLFFNVGIFGWKEALQKFYDKVMNLIHILLRFSGSYIHLCVKSNCGFQFSKLIIYAYTQQSPILPSDNVTIIEHTLWHVMQPFPSTGASYCVICK